jgi:hypothetical protein
MSGVPASHPLPQSAGGHGFHAGGTGIRAHLEHVSPERPERVNGIEPSDRRNQVNLQKRAKLGFHPSPKIEALLKSLETRVGIELVCLFLNKNFPQYEEFSRKSLAKRIRACT